MVASKKMKINTKPGQDLNIPQVGFALTEIFATCEFALGFISYKLIFIIRRVARYIL